MLPTKQFVNPYFEEDHQILKDTNTKVTAFMAEYPVAHKALCDEVAGVKRTVYGENGDDGLVTENKQHETVLRNAAWLLSIVIPIMAGGIGWLIYNAIQVAATLAKVK
jgi:hypothetical protein